MKRVQILLRTASTKPRSIEVENLDLNWDTRLHMAVLQVLDEWKAFRSSFRRPESIPNPSSDTQSAPNTWNVVVQRTVDHLRGPFFETFNGVESVGIAQIGHQWRPI